jgi:hypothetical protein
MTGRRAGAFITGVILGAVAGCESSTDLLGDASPDLAGLQTTVVGGPCVDRNDCAAGSRCLTGGDFPGGICTTPCAADSPCPRGSVCVDEAEGVCLLACTSPADCRAGYGCKGKPRKSTAGDALVCFKDK